MRSRTGCAVSVIYLLLTARMFAQASGPEAVTLFQNVRVLNRQGQLTAATNVLVRGNKIERISTTPIPTDPSGMTKIIVGGGRTLRPGMIDDHYHIMMDALPQAVGMAGDIGYINLLAASSAEAVLMRGFTTVRDMGGPSFALKRAIDEGILPGPRIYPSGRSSRRRAAMGIFECPMRSRRSWVS